MIATTRSIGENDVLCGRGGATNNHVGNKRFRAIVTEYQAEYLEARKKEKAVVARCIVDRIKHDGGRFLKRDEGVDAWVEVTPKKATDKTSQALREGLDVRHKSYRTEKMSRSDTDSGEESPRKRTRLVMGKVIDSPSITGISGELTSVPELNEEEHPGAPAAEPMLLFFPLPSISQADCNDVAEV